MSERRIVSSVFKEEKISLPKVDAQAELRERIARLSDPYAQSLLVINGEEWVYSVDVTQYPFRNSEIVVAALILQGYSDKEIAEALCLTVGSVKNHVHGVNKIVSEYYGAKRGSRKLLQQFLIETNQLRRHSPTMDLSRRLETGSRLRRSKLSQKSKPKPHRQTPPKVSKETTGSFSSIEKNIYQLIASGESMTEIASTLNMTEQKVGWYLFSILKKISA